MARPAATTRAERADVVAAIHRLATEVALDVPLYLVGYSFGADVAPAVGDDRRRRVAGRSVAPRSVVPRLAHARPADGDRRPVLVLATEHDQFAPAVVGMAPRRPRPA